MVELTTNYDKAKYMKFSHLTSGEDDRRRTRKYGFEYLITAVVIVSLLRMHYSFPSTVAPLRDIPAGHTNHIKKTHPIEMRGRVQAEIEDAITNVTTTLDWTVGASTNGSNQTTTTILLRTNSSFNKDKRISHSASLPGNLQPGSQNSTTPIVPNSRSPDPSPTSALMSCCFSFEEEIDDFGRELPTPDIGCCYSFDETRLAEMIHRFTPEYFVQQQKTDPVRSWRWTGKEYEVWRDFLVQILPSKYPGHGETQLTLSCENQWRLMVLSSSKMFYLPLQIKALGGEQEDWFPYVPDLYEAPRVLQLGDSISHGIWNATFGMFSKLKSVNLHGAPGNCVGFENYEKHLDVWLGNCEWDIVQFNVGQHYHPPGDTTQQDWRQDYANGLRQIVSRIRNHSPSAHVIFATTTPSPMDSKETFPDEKTCRHFDKFHKPGFVSSMNQVAREVAEEMNFTVNDRYAAIQPLLGKYQKPCDVHFKISGSEYLASKDWGVFSELLGLGS